MVLYRSPEQTDLHTYCWNFSQVHCSKFYSPAPPPTPPTPQPPPPPPPTGAMFFSFYASWQLNLERGPPKEDFCHAILKLVQWFLTKRFLKCFVFYIAIKPYPLTSILFFFFFEESWQLEKKLGRGQPNEHSCQVKLKSVQWILTRRFSKFSI